MSKTKRSLEEEILHYKKKIQKLEEKIPSNSGTITLVGEYTRELGSAAPSEVPDRRDSRNISPAPETRPARDIPETSIQPSIEWRPPRDISPIREARKSPEIIASRRRYSHVASATDPRQLRDIAAIEQVRDPPHHISPATQVRDSPRDISTATQVRDPPRDILTAKQARDPPRDILTATQVTDPPRDISTATQVRDPPRDISNATQVRDPPRHILTATQVRDPPRDILPATQVRDPLRDILPATQVRDPPPVALGTPSSPLSVVRGPDEPRVLPQPNLNLTEDNTVDSYISTSTPVQQRATGKKRRKCSETGLAESTDEMDRKEALINALGDDLSLSGENIHASLAQKWTNILRKGLPIDTKDNLFKEYSAPDNCRLLRAPILNDEIYTIAEFNSRNRDKILEGKQNQLGLGISAIGKAITMLLNQDENYEVNAMRHFNHGCRLLLDLHYTETSSRRHLFKGELARSDVFRHLKIQDLERDDTLFGNKLAKMVKKQGIPPTPAHQRPSSSSYGDLPQAPHYIRKDSPRYRRRS